MPKKFQIFFFIWVLIVMFSFAMVGIFYAMMRGGLALAMFVVAILLTGIGFMIRKRVLRRMGMIPEKMKN
jgi:hypothetical protein